MTDVELLIRALIIGLAAARITRLIFKDTIFDEVRRKLILWLEEDLVIGAVDGQGDPVPGEVRLRRWRWLRHKLSYLITCPYCASAYAAIAALHLPDWTVIWFAVWMVAIMAIEYTDGDEG